MPRTLHSISSALTLQALLLGGLSLSSVAWTWRAVDQHELRVAIPAQRLQNLQSLVSEATVAPYARLAGVGEDNDTVLADARAEVRVLRALGVVGSSTERQLQTAFDVLEATELSLRPEIDAAARTAALAELSVARVTTRAALDQVEADISSAAGAQLREATSGLLVLWGGLLVCTLATGVVARRRGRDFEAVAVHSRQTTQNAGAAALQAALEGRPPADPDQLGRAFAGTIHDVADELERLRRENTRIHRRTTFHHQIAEALALSETEEEVLRTAARAARHAFPASGWQVLLADDPAQPVQAQESEAPVLCGLAAAQSCPAVRKGRPMLHGPGDGLSRCPRLHDDLTAVSCAPVVVAGRAVGVAQLVGEAPDHDALEELESLAMSLGSRLGVVRNLAERQHEAVTDPLTELPNRRMLTERLDRLDQSELPYAVVTLDVDHFKRLNDTHGHDEGDRSLQTLARVLRAALRETDLPCRMGGEEFLVLLPGADMEAGLRVAGRIRDLLAEAVARARAPYTVSMGVAASPVHGESGESVLRAADMALYAAKDAGRNRIQSARTHQTLEVVG